MAAIVANSTVATGAAGTVAATKPTGSASGDMLLAFHAADFGAASTMTAPSGWTQVGLADLSGGTGSAIRIKCWQADGAVASATFSNNSGADAVVIVVRITGQDPVATPVVASAAASGQGSGAAVTTPFDAPSVTPAGSNDLLLCAGGAEAGSSGTATTWTDPSGMTRVNAGQSTTWTALDVVSLPLTSSAATSTETFTPVGPANWLWAALSVAVKSAAGSVTVARPQPRNRARLRRASTW